MFFFAQCLDRTGGGKFCEEYELATSKLEEFSETLRREQEERKNIVKALEDGEAFYDVSYGEVKVIVHVSEFIIVFFHAGLQGSLLSYVGDMCIYFIHVTSLSSQKYQ